MSVGANASDVDDTWMETAKPVTMRQYFRQGKHFKKPTCGISKGFTQTNMTMLHKSIAGNFGEFCRANSGPLPLVHQSGVGEFTATKISQEDSDIRTDLSAYLVFEDGKKSSTVRDLLSFGDKLNEFVFFYLGCSFSFDLALLQAGVPLRCLERKCNVSVYKTNIHCRAVGEFDCCQCVSMRPIPKELIQKAFAVTLPLNDVHGAPIHIGNPDAIGVKDISKPDYGDISRFHVGDIPVFWSCGVTGLEAVLSAKPQLAFTHCPGNMYITDTLLNIDQYTIGGESDPANVPQVITLAEEPYLASVTSSSVVEKIKKLEQMAFEDVAGSRNDSSTSISASSCDMSFSPYELKGNRQISALLVADDLLKSALTLSHSSSVLITTGFPCFLEDAQPYESDGIAGAVAVATTLQALGTTVTLVAEKGFYGILTEITASMFKEGIVAQEIHVVQYPPENTCASKETAREFLTNADGVTPKYDHLVALERTGQASDGKHYTMNGTDISLVAESLDYLFIAAAEMPLVFTTGVGDGGNEIGMGKVQNAVITNVPKGDVISCATSTDYLITSGVSDWGGYALAMALYLLRTCPIHERYQRRAVGFPPTEKQKIAFAEALPSVTRERKLLELYMRHDIKDGIAGCTAMSVDGLPFDGVLDIKIKNMLAVIMD